MSISYSIEIPDLEIDQPALLKACALAIEGLVLDGFDRSVDPYGEPWAPLQHRDGQPLVDTGIMRQSVRSYAHGDNAGVLIDAEYASYHQTGTRWIPARKMFPDEGQPSARWDNEIEAVVNDFLEATIK